MQSHHQLQSLRRGPFKKKVLRNSKAREQQTFWETGQTVIYLTTNILLFDSSVLWKKMMDFFNHKVENGFKIEIYSHSGTAKISKSSNKPEIYRVAKKYLRKWKTIKCQHTQVSSSFLCSIPDDWHFSEQGWAVSIKFLCIYRNEIHPPVKYYSGKGAHLSITHKHHQVQSDPKRTTGVRKRKHCFDGCFKKLLHDYLHKYKNEPVKCNSIMRHPCCFHHIPYLDL